MGPSEFGGLPEVTPDRVCGCGQPIRWSHLQYLDKGRSAPIYICAGCGLAYRGRGSDPGRGGSPARSRRPLPDQGPPDNPVLDEATAARLRKLLSGP